MKRTIAAVSFLLLAVVTVAQSSAQKPAPELKKWDVWIGDWDDALGFVSRTSRSTIRQS